MTFQHTRRQRTLKLYYTHDHFYTPNKWVLLNGLQNILQSALARTLVEQVSQTDEPTSISPSEAGAMDTNRIMEAETSYQAALTVKSDHLLMEHIELAGLPL